MLCMFYSLALHYVFSRYLVAPVRAVVSIVLTEEDWEGQDPQVSVIWKELDQSPPQDFVYQYSEEGVLQTEFGLDLSLFILLRNIWFYFRTYPKSVAVWFCFWFYPKYIQTINFGVLCLNWALPSLCQQDAWRVWSKATRQKDCYRV